MKAGDWTWLEVAKLVVALLTPAAVATLGIYVHRITKRFEDLQWRSQKLVEKRLFIYDDMAPDFNDLLCYFTYVGGWKEIDPPAMVSLKRVLDKKIYLAAPLFSESFFEACMRFQSLCFHSFIGWGRDAQLRSHFERRKEARDDWKVEWDYCFTIEITDPKVIQTAYNNVMEEFVSNIGVDKSLVVPKTGRVPANIR